MKVEVNKPELVDLSMGCEMRKKHHQNVDKLKAKIGNLEKEIAKLKERIEVELLADSKLANEGFCLIDKKKVTKNALTGQVMKIELVHTDNCISSKGE